jgi:membrane-associated phospholipid phosphatase
MTVGKVKWLSEPAALFAIAFVAPALSQAQTLSTSEARDLRNLGGDVWSVWTSPVRLDERKLLPVAASAGIIVIAVAADSAIWHLLSTNSDALPLRLLAPVRSGGVGVLKDLTTSTYLIPLSVAAYAAGRLSNSTPLRDAGLGCGASYLASLGVRLVAYGSVGRTRPYVAAGPRELSFPGFGDWDRRSFTAGHAGNAAACASFLGNRFALGAGEPLMYLYVAAVGLGRMADGWHWASDTVTGVILGVAIGSAISDRFLVRHRPGDTQQPAVAPLPLFRFRVTF